MGNILYIGCEIFSGLLFVILNKLEDVMIAKTVFNWTDSGHKTLIYRIKLTFLR